MAVLTLSEPVVQFRGTVFREDEGLDGEIFDAFVSFVVSPPVDQPIVVQLRLTSQTADGEIIIISFLSLSLNTISLFFSM